MKLPALLAGALLFAAPALADGIVVSDAWSRATPPAAPVAAGYLTLTNKGPAADRLIGVTTGFAERAEIHHSAVTNGVMRMTPLPGGVELPAGETVTLAPGGTHIMFIKPSHRLMAGETVAAVLEFENSGPVAAEFAVRPMGATAAHDGHGAAP